MILWDLCTKLGHLRTYDTQGEKVQSFVISKDDRFIFTGGSSCTVKMYRLETGEVEKSFVGHTGPIKAIILTKRNEYVVTGKVLNVYFLAASY